MRKRVSWVILLSIVACVGCGDGGAEGEGVGPAGGSNGNGGAVGATTGGAGGMGETSSTGSGAGGAGAAPGCFAEGQVPPTASPAGFAMPSLDDERATYLGFGWTWAPEAEPSYPGEPDHYVSDPDLHGDTEADDLWTHVMMHERTGQQGYLDRAAAWARYFKEDYLSCEGGQYYDFCFDRDEYGADHLWGWGLVAWHLATGDAEALAEAEKIAEAVETLWSPRTSEGCLPVTGCMAAGPRRAARHLLLVTRVAEVTGAERWAKLRDQIIDVVLASSLWDEAHGTYFVSEDTTDTVAGPGAYASGIRMQSAFQIGVLTEAFDHAYRNTGRSELRDRMVRIGEHVAEHGLDPTYQYTASWFGVVDGATWHSYSASEPVTYWDPVYTTSLVNTLVRGYRYTCDGRYLGRAKQFFERGNRGVAGDPLATATPDGVVHHFVDTIFDSSSGYVYLDYNKGELQYTYLLFAPQD